MLLSISPLLTTDIHPTRRPPVGNPIPGVNPVPNEFMGFSVEVSHIIDYLADAEKGAPNPRPSLVHLFGFGLPQRLETLQLLEPPQ